MYSYNQLIYFRSELFSGGLTVKGYKLSRNISGTTWEVYLHILTSKDPVGVRDVWRTLKFSSPSLAQYHINKLLEMDLVGQTQDGKYWVKEKAQIQVLKSFVLLRGRLISRLVFYSALIAGLFGAYVIYGSVRWNFRDLVVLIVSVFSVGAFLVEAYIQHRSLRAAVQKV